MENTAPNGNSSLMIGLILGAFIALLLLKSCQPERPQIAKGTFKPIKPIHTIQIDTIYKNHTKVLYKENRVLDSIFINSTDTVKVEIYRDAISIKQFNHTFKDCTATINASGLVRGTVESLSIDYKLKLIPERKTIFMLSGGTMFGASKTLSDPVATALILGQFKNGNQLLFGYDTQNNISIGGTVSIFNVKR